RVLGPLQHAGEVAQGDEPRAGVADGGVVARVHEALVGVEGGDRAPPEFERPAAAPEVVEIDREAEGTHHERPVDVDLPAVVGPGEAGALAEAPVASRVDLPV